MAVRRTLRINGIAYRWVRKVNGVTTVDINADVDITETNKNDSTFTATTGQTVTVVRTGSPATTLVPPVYATRFVPYDPETLNTGYDTSA